MVDANPRFRGEILRALTSFYEVSEHSEQGAALEAIANVPPAAIILDENVLPRGGLPLLREICCVPDLDRIPILCTATPERRNFLADATLLGVRSTLIKPFRRSSLLKALSNEINGTIERRWLKIEPLERAALQRTTQIFNTIADMIGEDRTLPYEELQDACAPLVEAVRTGHYRDMLVGVRDHDNYTYVHSLRVAIFLAAFGHAIGLRDEELSVLAVGGLIHDVGKMSVPYGVLNKPGRLSDEELATARGHVLATRRFLEKIPGLPRGALTIALQHHEKLDGSGYPFGVKAGELNDLARMATITDIYGALTDLRPYKDAMAPDLALFIMTQQKKQLDQRLLSMFRTVMLDIAATLP